MDFVRDVYLHHHHLVNLGEPNRMVFALIKMMMKTASDLSTSFTRTTPFVIEGTTRKLLWSSTASRTCLTTVLQENNSSGHVATRTQQLDSLAVGLILRSSSSHDIENFISTADLVLIQTKTKYFITTSVQKYKMIFDILVHIRLHIYAQK